MTLRKIATARGHRYTLDGRAVKGVTTLLSGGMPKPALTYWAAKTVAEYVADNDAQVETLRGMGRGPMIAALKGVPWETRDQAANRGTEVHALAEQLVQGHAVDVPELLAGHVESYVRFLDEWQPVPLLVERACAHRTHWWAGTFDLIADMADERWLLDVKTSKGVYGETAMQVDAYRHAEFYLDDDGAEQPLPEGITRLGVIHVRGDGYDLIPMTADGSAYRDFRHVAFVANAADRIKSYQGEPLAPPSTPTATEDAA